MVAGDMIIARKEMYYLLTEMLMSLASGKALL